MRDQFFDMASRGVKRSAEATANEVCKLRKEMEELRELLNKSEGRVKESRTMFMRHVVLAYYEATSTLKHTAHY